MPMTDDEIQMLATLTAHCRPHGATRWDPPGIIVQLRKVANRSLPEVMRACAIAAADRSNRTPAIIAMPGPHWRPETADIPTIVPASELCRDCGKRQGPQHPDDHPFTPYGHKPAALGYGSDAAARARKALAGVRLEKSEGPPPRTVAPDPGAGAGCEA